MLRASCIPGHFFNMIHMITFSSGNVQITPIRTLQHFLKPDVWNWHSRKCVMWDGNVGPNATLQFYTGKPLSSLVTFTFCGISLLLWVQNFLLILRLRTFIPALPTQQMPSWFFRGASSLMLDHRHWLAAGAQPTVKIGSRYVRHSYHC